jgi:hypothetical protein
MNWGKATILVLLAFVLFISGMSIYMFRSPTDDYDHQYYEDGLNFDHDYNREAQVTRDHAQPLITVSKDSIIFVFPQPIKGRVTFMRPSSDAKDAVYALDNKNSKPMQFETAALTKGKWQLVVEWESNRKAYLYHQEVYIP